MACPMSGEGTPCPLPSAMIFTRAPSPPARDSQAQWLDLAQFYIFYTQPALVAQQTSFNPRRNEDVNENKALTDATIHWSEF